MSNQFNHSVRVPRLYKVAAKVAQEFSEGVNSIKQLLYGEKKKHPVSNWVMEHVKNLFCCNYFLESKSYIFTSNYFVSKIQ